MGGSLEETIRGRKFNESVEKKKENEYGMRTKTCGLIKSKK